MFTGTIAITVGVCGLLLCAGYLAVTIFDRYSAQVEARLRAIPSEDASKRLAGRLSVSPAEGDAARRGTPATSLLKRLAHTGGADRRRQESRLVQAGFYNPAAISVLLAVKLILVAAPPVLGLLGGWWGIVELRSGLLWGCIAGGCGLFLPSFWMDRRIRRRHCILRRSLADFLDLMIVCLESGLSLQGTIQRVSDELRTAHPLLAGELHIVQRDIELGATVDGALRRFADRSGYEGIRTLSTFVRESQRFGTELAQALRVHAEMLRSQREMIAEETAQKASVKILIPMLLLILPAVFVVLAGPALIQIQEAFSKR